MRDNLHHTRGLAMTDSVITQWLETEKQILALHAQGPGPGVGDLRALAQKNGLDIM